MEWSVVLAAALHHLVVVGVSIRIGVGAARRVGATGGRNRWIGLAGGAGLLFVATTASAAFFASAAHDPFFAWVRLVCQAVFGEGFVLLLAVAGLHLARGRRVAAVSLAAAAAGLFGVYWEAYHHGPRDLRVRTLDVALHDATPGADLRVLHLSDIQTDAVGAYERRAVRAGLDLGPDLVVLTGDYLQRGLRPLGPRARHDMRALLASLRAPDGVYAVPGDTDRGCALFTGLHVRCLEDETVRVALADGRVLALTGLRPRTSRAGDPGRLRPILERAPPADLAIVFGHSPDYVRALAGWSRVDLALAGHTHGGQIVLPGVGPLVTLSRLPRRYAGGLNGYHGIPLHVSRGIGLERGSAPPIRFFCPPEISLLQLRTTPSRHGREAAAESAPKQISTDPTG